MYNMQPLTHVTMAPNYDVQCVECNSCQSDINSQHEKHNSCLGMVALDMQNGNDVITILINDLQTIIYVLTKLIKNA